jgi:heptosyltransferase-3
MQGLTRNVGTSSLTQNTGSIQKGDIKNVLICRPNHRLGNLLLTTPLVEEVVDSFPDCKIDLLVKGNLAPAVFRNYKNINSFIAFPKKPFKELIKYSRVWLSLRKTHYDIVINVVNDSSSGRLSAQFATSKYKFFGGEHEALPSEYQDLHIARQPVYYFRYCLTLLGFADARKEVPLMNLKLSDLELTEGKKKLKTLVNNDRKTICLFTYATGDKCYSKEWWEEFYEQLKTNYSDYNIIEILPVENISNISFQAPTYAHPDIRNVGAVIANTQLFIGADGGVMHLATAAQVPTIGLFSVTDPKSYAPYNAGSIGVNTNETSTVDLLKIAAAILK